MNFKIWLHGLLVVAVSTFATAISGAFLLPSVFTFTHDGFINVLKMGTVPTVVAVCAYLKQSPLPALTLTVTNKTEVTKS